LCGRTEKKEKEDPVKAREVVSVERKKSSEKNPIDIARITTSIKTCKLLKKKKGMGFTALPIIEKIDSPNLILLLRM